MNQNNDRFPNVVNMVYGSHLYQLDTPQSDIDYKGIYIPTQDELLLHNYPKTIKSSTGNPHEKNLAGDIDREVIALPRFLELAVQGETLAIDMLHCKNPLTSSWVWDELVSRRTMFYSKNLKAFVGYVKRQASKYGLKGSRLADISRAIKVLEEYDTRHNKEENIILADIWDELPEGEYLKKVTLEQPNKTVRFHNIFYEVNVKKYQSTLLISDVLDMLRAMYDGFGHRAKLAEKNDGVDWKAMSHALRAGYQAWYIYKDGDYEYPLPETEFLKDVKLGKLDFKTIVLPELENLVRDVELLANVSNIPEKVDRAYWDEWLLKVYSQMDNMGTYGKSSNDISYMPDHMG